MKTLSFESPLELYRRVLAIWSADTASPTGAWCPSFPAKNHCSVTSLVVQDYFGGEILTTRTRGGTHFYNVIEGTRWDLTVGQFSEPIPYEDNVSSREAALRDTSLEKYELLKQRLSEGSL